MKSFIKWVEEKVFYEVFNTKVNNDSEENYQDDGANYHDVYFTVENIKYGARTIQWKHLLTPSEGLNVLEFHFTQIQNDEFINTITNTGNALEVFGKVINVVENDIRKLKPDVLMTAYNPKEPSRGSLYRKFMKRYQASTIYKHEINIKSPLIEPINVTLAIGTEEALKKVQSVPNSH